VISFHGGKVAWA